MQKCFESFSDLTVHLIAFELLKSQTFAPGELIVPINKRSMVNEQHKASLVPQTNLLVKSVLKKIEESDK
jgi:hypothetical protein